MNIQKFTKNTQADLQRLLECIQIEEDLWIYKVKFDVNFHAEDLPENFKNAFTLPSYQGITTTEQIQKFKDGETFKVKDIDYLCVVQKEFLELAKREGFPEALDKHYKNIYQNTSCAYDLYITGNIDIDNLVKVNRNNHTLADRKDLPIETAIHFSYIDGHMRNGSYDLQKAYEHLKNNPQIRFLSDDKYDSTKIIQDVPYYNRSSSSSHYLSFLFTPTQEQYLAICQKRAELSPDCPTIETHQAIFDLDTLELRSIGAAKYDTYYGCDDDIQCDEDDMNM